MLMHDIVCSWSWRRHWGHSANTAPSAEGIKATYEAQASPDPRLMHARSHGAANGHHMTTPELVRRVWHPALALFLSASTAVLLFPFFTYVPLHGRMNGLLPQVLPRIPVPAHPCPDTNPLAEPDPNPNANRSQPQTQIPSETLFMSPTEPVWQGMPKAPSSCRCMTQCASICTLVRGIGNPG